MFSFSENVPKLSYSNAEFKKFPCDNTPNSRFRGEESWFYFSENVPKRSYNNAELHKISRTPGPPFLGRGGESCLLLKLGLATPLDLSWNKIKELHRFPPLTQFYISGNPMKCDCAALPSLSSISQFVDFKTTICTSSPANNPSFLLCHLANQTECFQQTVITNLNSTRDFCTANIPDQSMQVPRYSNRKSCRVPTPRILELYLTPTDTGFETWWKMETVGGISGFQLTWETDGWKNTTFMPIDGNQTGSNINTTLHSPGNYVVCLRVIMIDQSLIGDYRCQNVTVFLNSSGCRTGGTQCPVDSKSTQESGLFPLLLYIIIPVAGFLVIVVIIVVVCVCVRRRRQEEDAKKGQGVHRTLSGTSDGEKESGFQAGLAEQATVSMDMFTECPY